MKCPTCNISLVMTDRSGVEIDYCPECRGVWLDRGELDKIIERASQSANTSQPGRPQERQPYPQNQPYISPERQHYSKEEEYRYKKKKGFLGDLFDF